MTPNEEQTLYSLVDGLRTFALAHEQLHAFSTGTLAEVDWEKLTAAQRPLLHVAVGTCEMDEGSTTIDLEVVVATQQPPSQEAQLAVQSNTLYLMRDVVAYLKHHLYDDSYVPGAVLQMPVAAEPFIHRFDNLLVGWAALLTIELPAANNLCIVPRTP